MHVCRWRTNEKKMRARELQTNFEQKSEYEVKIKMLKRYNKIEIICSGPYLI